MEAFFRSVEKIIPEKLYRACQPVYHYVLAFVGAVIYRFPSRNINIVFITGTKGKSSTVEFTNSILEAAGYKTAVAGTIRFKIGEVSRPNLHKMTIPGRFFLQKFLRRAVDAGCDYAVVEMTSEGARQFRHAFIDFDALVFLNLSPEHIESHGSYEKYVQAKLSLAYALEKSPKKRKILVANADDKEAARFLAVNIPEKYPFTLAHAQPYELFDGTNKKPAGVSLTFQGEKITSPLPGEFTIYNILAAATYTLNQNVPIETIKRGIERVQEISGRLQKITSTDPKIGIKQHFDVVVDYAHTPDSLEKLYRAFPNHYLIGVLGNTGGGRDTWKRPTMGKIADTYCDSIILTDEDPYDDDPRTIVEEMAEPISEKRKVDGKPLAIIMDRRQAIHEAIMQAKIQTEKCEKNKAADEMVKKVAILISGKGTDPYIMRASGKKEPWSDAKVAQEELEKILK